MARIIVDFPDGYPEELMLGHLLQVIKQGRISQAGGVHHYCWITVFGDGTEVITRRKKRGQKTDSFRVR